MSRSETIHSKVQSLEQRLRSLEVLNDSLFPLVAISTTATLFGVSIVPIAAAAVAAGIVKVGIRQYLRKNKVQIGIEIESLRERGEVGEEEYVRLRATLNRLTEGRSARPL